VVSVLPDSFLGGSAPHLRELKMRSIPFPSIPKLLLSADRLVTLNLKRIPHSGYFSPDAMATALTAMTRLESLSLRFSSPRSRPDPASRPLPPPKRFILPALTKLRFEGVYEYLEDLLTPIDAPLLHDLDITFFMDLNFDVPQLRRLIAHADFKALDQGVVAVSNYSILLGLYPKTRVVGNHYTALELQIVRMTESDRGFSSLVQLCSSFPFISTLEELKIRGPQNRILSPEIENAWLQFFDLFTALKSLYLTDENVRYICDALQERSGERATEVLPALRHLFVQGFDSSRPIHAAMEFVAARRLSGHPMVIDCWSGR